MSNDQKTSPNPPLPPKRTRRDYLKYHEDQSRKLAPRYTNWPHHAYEATLALIMFDYPQRTEAECCIALAKWELYAPFTAG